MGNKSVKKSIFFMTCTNIINKILGAIYSILLVYLLTSNGVGLLNNALTIYTSLVVLFTAGFTTALTKLIAENYACGRNEYAHRLFKVSFYIFASIGVVATVIMYYLARYMAVDTDVYLSIYALMPSIFFVSLTTIFRGYFQGMMHIIPIAIAQMLEQLTKIIVGSSLAIMFLPDIRKAAYGAAIGFSAGTFVSLCVFIAFYMKYREGIHSSFTSKMGSDAKVMDLIKTMMKYVIPLSLGGFMIQAVSVIDQFVVNKILPYAGYSLEQSKQIYGVLTGQIAKLIDIPSVLTIALATSLLPVIARDFNKGYNEQLKQKASMAYSYVLFFAIPASLGMATLSQPILELVYGRNADAMGGAMLSVLAYTIIFIAIIQINNSILQGINKFYVPVISVACGLIAKIAISTLTICYPNYIIPILTVGSLAFYIIAASIGFYITRKSIRLHQKQFYKNVIKIIISSVVMLIFVLPVYEIVLQIQPYHRIATGSAVFIGMGVYTMCSLILNQDIVKKILESRSKR